MCMCLLSQSVDSGLHVVLNKGEEEPLGICLQEQSGGAALCFMEAQPLHNATKKSPGGGQQHSPIQPLSANRPRCLLHTSLMPICCIKAIPLTSLLGDELQTRFESSET